MLEGHIRPPGPTHPPRAICSISDGLSPCLGLGVQCRGEPQCGPTGATLQGEKELPPSKNVPFSQENFFFPKDLPFSHHVFPGGRCLASTLRLVPSGPFTAVRGAQASSKALQRIWWEGERGFYKLPFKNGYFEVM